jgi:DNA-directed RNA polymerase subunit RPC12/RpoP
VTEASCPHCGEPVERRQLVCLNCGGRVALRERTSWAREPVTALAAVLVVVIVIGAGLFGFAISELTSGDGDEPTRAASPGTTPEPAREEPAVVSGGEQPPRTAEQAPPAPAEPPADRVPGWPEGLSAHTVVLVTSSDRPAALRVAKEARASGLEAGLIRSEPYDLGSGLWIVFSGRFTTPEGAERQAAQLGDRYPGAYPQRVQKSQ